MKTAYQPHARWCDLVLGHTRQGQKLEAAYQALFGLTAFSPLSQIASVLGDDLTAFTTLALTDHPLRRVAAMHQTAQRDVQAFAGASRLPEAKALAKLRAGEAPKALLRRLPIQAYLASTNIDDFLRRLLELSRRPDGPSQLASALYLQGPGNLSVQHIYKLDQIDTLWQHLEALIGTTIERVTPLQSHPAVLDQFSESSRLLLQKELADDYATYGYGPEVEIRQSEPTTERFIF